MKKPTRSTVIAVFTVAAALIGAWRVPSGAGEVTIQETSCTWFEDWVNLGSRRTPEQHQHFEAPMPWEQQGDIYDWDFLGMVKADGRRHLLARGWTLDYGYAHHEPCETD